MTDDRAVVAHVRGRELPSEDVVVVAEAPTPRALRLVFLLLGLGLFVTALGLMKAGAIALIPALEDSVLTDNAWSTPGLGWLGACVVLSGSPVAASSLALFDGGAITRTLSFTMLTGSRLGAAFVVLVVGVVYAVRRRGTSGRRAPSPAASCRSMTALVYLPGAAVGYLLLERGAFDGFDVGTSPELTSATDALFGWAVDLLAGILPGWLLSRSAWGSCWWASSCSTRCCPPSAATSSRTEPTPGTPTSGHVLLGCGVTVLTLTVAVSLTLLVPLVAKGYLRRANTPPYIAGANITTLVDTLVAAVLLGNQDGVRVVVPVTVAVTALTLCLLALSYPLLRRVCLAAAGAAVRSPSRLAAFTAVLLVVPLSCSCLVVGSAIVAGSLPEGRCSGGGVCGDRVVRW